MSNTLTSEEESELFGSELSDVRAIKASACRSINDQRSSASSQRRRH